MGKEAGMFRREEGKSGREMGNYLKFNIGTVFGG
jgi:hypothetical protein